MSEDTFEKDLNAVMADIKALMLKQHKERGELAVEKFGELGMLVRSSDLLNRIESGILEEQKEDFDMEWKELAAHAIRCLILFYNEEDIDEFIRELIGKHTIVGQTYPFWFGTPIA